MVETPDLLMHGQSPRKSNLQIRRDETIELIRHALASKGMDSKQSFAIIALDENYNVRVHASGQVKGFLDEKTMGCGFREAYEKAVHKSFVVSEPVPEPTSAVSIDNDEGSDYGDNEFPLVPRKFGDAQGSRVYRTARQRVERVCAMIPCNASRHGHDESSTEPERVREVSPSEPEMEMVPVKKTDRSLRIDNEPLVLDFLKMRLKRMQQLAVKKIAKAWIKGICPKKQANFPYQNKKGEENLGFKPRVPAWWPDTRLCRFIEPDHIKREERMMLCIHLLRLRPSPAQLKEWNEDRSEPHPVHVANGWTAFLEELAGPSIFEELQNEDKKRTETKKQLLSDMYEVAKLEEGYFKGEIDGNATHSWEEDDEERRLAPSKRSHQEAGDFKVEQASRQSSESVEYKRVKKSRQSSVLDGQFQDMPYSQPSETKQLGGLPVEGTQHAVPSNDLLMAENAPQDSAAGSVSMEHFRSGVHGGNQYSAAPMKRDSSADDQWRYVETSQARWAENEITPNGFQTPSNHFAMPQSLQDAPPAPSNFNHQGYVCPQHQEQPHMVQVHQVSHVPEPQFQPVSSAPMYAPASMMSIPFGSFVPRDCGTSGPPSYSYANNMAQNQYYSPANPDPSMCDFQRHAPQHYQDQHTLAERHIAPMQVHGLPFTQPCSWEGRPFDGRCPNPS